MVSAARVTYKENSLIDLPWTISLTEIVCYEYWSDIADKNDDDDDDDDDVLNVIFGI